MKAKSKIATGVIGTHFYQTHPDGLDEFTELTTLLTYFTQLYSLDKT